MTSLLTRYGPWALVAGASEGIGAAFAGALAEAGFNLVLIARRPGPLESLAAELRAQRGIEIETMAFDLADPELEQRFEAIARDKPIGLVVYNAALSIVKQYLDTSLLDKQRMLDVNVRGPTIATHVFGRAFAARGGGGIVLVSSLTAFWGAPWLATYGATKAFNLSLGEALAHELAERGIDVVVSCAGATRTPGFDQLMIGRKAPRSMSPQAVARETLAALPGRGSFVPGAFNRMATQVLNRLLPRRSAVRILASQNKALL